MHHFYYDETEHSRIINYDTVKANNYYDNFVTSIVGWKVEDEKEIYDKYIEFEHKYDFRKKDGELKSLTMKQKDFQYGFASLNKNTIGFYEDLLEIFDEKIIIYLSVFSKIEYIINQLFKNYHNSLFVDVDYMKYSIVKFIVVYHPKNVIESIYDNKRNFIYELREFIKDRIEKNKRNIQLKQNENKAFEQILLLLNEIEAPETFEWNYVPSFDGFDKLLKEMNIKEYTITIDKEGESSKTLEAAQKIGIMNAIEGESIEFIGVRIADMLAGLIAKFMKALKKSLDNDYNNMRKKLLNYRWFKLNKRQAILYKKLYKIICVDNKYWYNTYSGAYSDDLIVFISFLQYISKVESMEGLTDQECLLQSEYFNSYACRSLQIHYERMRNKIPIEVIPDSVEDFFENSKGAKVYKDISKQPILNIKEGSNEYKVLSVGINNVGNPLVTIEDGEEIVCYRIPDEYREWAMTIVGIASIGENLFPEIVRFYLIDGKYYADIL